MSKHCGARETVAWNFHFLTALIAFESKLLLSFSGSMPYCLGFEIILGASFHPNAGNIYAIS